MVASGAPIPPATNVGPSTSPTSLRRALGPVRPGRPRHRPRQPHLAHLPRRPLAVPGRPVLGLLTRRSTLDSTNRRIVHAPTARVDDSRGVQYPDHMPDQIDPGMSGAWQIQEAKARFSELLRASVEDGPQTVTRRGVPLAVLVSVEQWNALRHVGVPTLKDLLLAPHARTTQLVPARRRLRRRPVTHLR